MSRNNIYPLYPVSVGVALEAIQDVEIFPNIIIMRPRLPLTAAIMIRDSINQECRPNGIIPTHRHTRANRMQRENSYPISSKKKKKKKRKPVFLLPPIQLFITYYFSLLPFRNRSHHSSYRANKEAHFRNKWI